MVKTKVKSGKRVLGEEKEILHSGRFSPSDISKCIHQCKREDGFNPINNVTSFDQGMTREREEELVLFYYKKTNSLIQTVKCVYPQSFTDITGKLLPAKCFHGLQARAKRIIDKAREEGRI